MRVLKPGGQLGILDFSEPGGLVGKGYRVYFRRVLPAVARIIGGKEGAYRYLPASVGKFPPPARDAGADATVGYTNCHWQPYTFGIAGLYTGTRAAAPQSEQERHEPTGHNPPEPQPDHGPDSGESQQALTIAEASRQKRRVALRSMLAAAVMTLLKLAAGIVSGSLGVLSDAAHSGLDLVARRLLFFRAGKRQARRRRPHLRPRQD
jgi:hypothetical protein